MNDQEDASAYGTPNSHKEERGKSPPPIPIQSALPNSLPSRAKAKGPRGKNTAIIACVGWLAFGTIALFFLNQLPNKVEQAKFNQNREKIIATSQKALEEGGFHRIFALRDQYSHVIDSEFQSLVGSAKKSELSQKKLAEAKASRERGRIHAFQIVGEDDHSFLGRKRMSWPIVAPDLEIPQDAAATAIYAAKRLQSATGAETVGVLVYISSDIMKSGQWTAKAVYIPDGKGMSGEDTSPVWEVEHRELPNELATKKLTLYGQNYESFRHRYGESRFDSELTKFIIGELNLTEREYSHADAMLFESTEYQYDGKSLTFESPETKNKIDTAIETQSSVRERSFVKEFGRLLEEANIGSQTIPRIQAEGLTVTVTVSNVWHYEPKQVRIQVTQNLWSRWQKIASPYDPDKACIRIVDLNGNEVGGSRALGGSLIWVQD